MPCGESPAATVLHGQLLQLTYNTAEPTTSSPVAATAAHGAGPGAAAVTPRLSRGIATTMTPATVSAAASRTNVIVSGPGPLPAVDCHQAPATTRRCAAQSAAGRG